MKQELRQPRLATPLHALL